MISSILLYVQSDPLQHSHVHATKQPAPCPEIPRCKQQDAVDIETPTKRACFRSRYAHLLIPLPFNRSKHSPKQLVDEPARPMPFCIPLMLALVISSTFQNRPLSISTRESSFDEPEQTPPFFSVSSSYVRSGTHLSFFLQLLPFGYLETKGGVCIVLR